MFFSDKKKTALENGFLNYDNILNVFLFGLGSIIYRTNGVLISFWTYIFHSYIFSIF